MSRDVFDDFEIAARVVECIPDGLPLIDVPRYVEHQLLSEGCDPRLSRFVSMVVRLLVEARRR